MEKKANTFISMILIAASIVFLIVENLTHIEFFFHLAAIPLEVLLAVFIVERLLEKRQYKEKRRQLMFIKSHIFRGEMRPLFLKNFAALKYPSLSMAKIKNSSLEELRRFREEAERVEYRSKEDVEKVILEYVKAKQVWQQFLERAIQYNFEDIIEDMIYILHFIYDINLCRENNPGGSFIEEVVSREPLLAKSYKVLGDGIRKFIDYAIELKEKEPQMFASLMEDYELCSQMCLI